MEAHEADLFEQHLVALESGIADARAATKARDYGKFVKALKFIVRLFVIMNRVVEAVEDNNASKAPSTSGGTR